MAAWLGGTMGVGVVPDVAFAVQHARWSTRGGVGHLSDNREPMPEPKLFTGPILPDLEKAAGIGVLFGGLAGFVVACVRYPLTEYQRIAGWAAYSGSLAGVFAI